MQQSVVEEEKTNGEEEGGVLGKRKRDELGWKDMDRKQRARFLIKNCFKTRK